MRYWNVLSIAAMLEILHDPYGAFGWGCSQITFYGTILYHVECLISGASLGQRTLKWPKNIQSFLTGEKYWLSFCLSQPYTDLEIIALGLMNIFQWNFVCNEVCLDFSQGCFTQVFCIRFLLICAVKYHASVCFGYKPLK